MRKLFQRVPSWVKNKYGVTVLLFLVWMLFFDRNNIISQLQLTLELKELNDKNEIFREKISEVKLDKEELFTNREALEKFAREKYWMKKPNEDIYIIVEE